MPRPKQRTPVLAEALLAVAVVLLEEGGAAAVTVRAVATRAHTSPQAIYELYGGKADLLRAVFFHGFGLLGQHLAALAATNDAMADLRATLRTVGRFTEDRPALAELMFSRPFAHFDPSEHDRAAGAQVREAIAGPTRRAVAAGQLGGNPDDLAHVLLAVVQGLALQQRAGWLGTSAASRRRRWELGLNMVIAGAAPAA